MAEIVPEATGAILNGTDAATPLGKPAVDVVLDARGGDAPKSVVDSVPKGSGLQRVVERLRAKERGDTPAAPAAPATPADPTEELAPEEPIAADAAPADPADPAEEPAPDAETPPEEPPTAPEPAELAAARAEAETARAEAAALQRQLETAQLGGVSEDERVAYIDRPLDVIRGVIARHLGVKPDAKEVTDELAHLQRELTLEAIGADSLPDDRRDQRARDQSDRRWRLDQQIKASDRKAAQEREQRTAAVKFLGSVYEQARTEYPALSLVQHLERRPAEEVVMDVYLAGVRQGLIRPDLSDADAAREALRLTNQIYSRRAEALRAHVTAPAQAPAPAAASATSRKPGAPAPATPPAPAPKSRPAPPRAVSATAAAAAPVAKPVGSNPRVTVIEVDPNDRDARAARARQIAERRFNRPAK